MTAQLFAFVLLLASAPVPVVIGQSSQSIAPQTVEVSSDKLRLKAFLWTPAGSGPFPAVLFCHGSGSSDPAHTGPFAITAAAETLGPIFVKHGYAFLYLFRRGQGLSADQGEFMQDLLQCEKAAKGEEARKRLQFRLLTTDHLDDVTAGLSFFEKPSGNRCASRSSCRALVWWTAHATRGGAEQYPGCRHIRRCRSVLGKLVGSTRAPTDCGSQDNRSGHARSRGE
jgi:hypothetical protein